MSRSDSHDHPHPAHRHNHPAALPHPAQPAPWSILRMTLGGRIAMAVAISAGLWAVVLTAMR
jgi:hypothetical protein